MQRWQKLALPQQISAASVFPHAGLYIGGGMLVDVQPGDGVARRSVWYYCQNRALMLRRLKPGDADRPSAAAIAEKASTHLGKSYSVLKAALTAMLPSTPADPDRLFCSSFVDVVVAEATGVKLSMLPTYRPLFPAVLVVHPELETVPLEWRPMASISKQSSRREPGSAR